MSTDLLTAFEALLEEMNQEKKRLADELRDTTLQGRFEEAQHLLTITQRLVHMIQKIRALQGEWTSLERALVSQPVEYNTEGSVREKPEKELPAIADERAPELRIAKRIFGGESEPKRRRRSSVVKTPHRAFRLPILEALEQLEGKGQVAEVLSIIYNKMQHNLTEDDLKQIPSGTSVRWQCTARWERQDMVTEGLVRGDSSRGVWEMSDAGRKYLEHMRQKNEGEDSV